jgi:hypothetical protein
MVGGSLGFGRFRAALFHQKNKSPTLFSMAKTPTKKAAKKAAKPKAETAEDPKPSPPISGPVGANVACAAAFPAQSAKADK